MCLCACVGNHLKNRIICISNKKVRWKSATHRERKTGNDMAQFIPTNFIINLLGKQIVQIIRSVHVVRARSRRRFTPENRRNKEKSLTFSFKWIISCFYSRCPLSSSFIRSFYSRLANKFACKAFFFSERNLLLRAHKAHVYWISVFGNQFSVGDRWMDCRLSNDCIETCFKITRRSERTRRKKKHTHTHTTAEKMFSTTEFHHAQQE